MSYFPPHEVTTPKGSVSNLKPILDLGEGEFAVAIMDWDGNTSVGIRWNGESSDGKSLGNPQSRGLPTWFIVPSMFEREILNKVLDEQAISNKIPLDFVTQTITDFLQTSSVLNQYSDSLLESKIADVVIRLKSEGKI